ncbi:MAG TPA: hypothetical protein ENJ30_05585 [Desulfobulbaceae bacterium]|nr:hypothetical protein [Desulfobulbaceae bacterium]
MDPEQLMNALGSELKTSIRDMAGEEDLDRRVKQSEIVKNLSESMGVFLRLISDVMSADFDGFEEDYDDDYDEYEE